MTKQQLQTIWILYVALFSSIVIYAVVAVVIDSQGGVPPAGDPNLDPATLEYLFLALGGAAMIASLAVPGFLFRVKDGEALPYQQLFTKKILQWALTESIAIFGLVLFFLTGELTDMYIFAAWSAVIMLVHGPFGLSTSAGRG